MLTGLSFILYIYIYYVSYVVPHILNLSNLTHVTSISSADAMCSTMGLYNNSSARVPESSGNREDRLQRRRERERARRASETAEQREERLRVRRVRDRARRAAQTAEEREARLRQIHDNQCQSLATESEEQRAVRLQQMRDRLVSETVEERAARLQQMSANQRHRLAAETGGEREARLQRNREGQRGQQSQLSLFEQPSVQAKMRNFHAEIAALEMQKCTSNNAVNICTLRLRNLNCQTPAFASLPSLIQFFTHHIPRGLGCTSRPAPATPHQPLCTRLHIHRIRAHTPPTMLCIHLVSMHEMLTNQILLLQFEAVATPWLQYVRPILVQF